VKAWLAFAACSAIWGSTFLAISIGNESLAPVWGATLRLALASLLLGAFTVLRRESFPRGAALRTAFVYGVCQFGINFPLLYWGEQRIPSGLSAVCYATIPLSSALLTRAVGLEALTPAKISGALVALVGVALLFANSFHGTAAPAGLAAVLAAATSAGIGNVLLKRGPRPSPIPLNAVGCAVGAVMAGVATAVGNESHALPTTAAAILPLLYLTVAGSLGAFVIMSWLVLHWPVTRASYVSVVVPLLALILGAVFRQEPLTTGSVAGAALVLGGLVLGMRGGPSPAGARPPASLPAD